MCRPFPRSLFAQLNELLSATRRGDGGESRVFDFLSRFCGGIKKITEQCANSVTVCYRHYGHIKATASYDHMCVRVCECVFVVFSQFLLQQQAPSPSPFSSPSPFLSNFVVFPVVSLLFVADYFSSFISKPLTSEWFPLD